MGAGKLDTRELSKHLPEKYRGLSVAPRRKQGSIPELMLMGMGGNISFKIII